MYVAREIVDVTTATDGVATAYTPRVNGAVREIVYLRDGASAFASTADIAVTSELDGRNIWTEANVNASKTVRPVRPGSTASGAAASGSVPIHLGNDRVKIAIAQGGNTKAGRFIVYLG